MWKLFKRLVSLLVIAGVLYTYSAYRDRKALNDGVIRLHVVADSDEQEAQSIKLKVRDAVLTALEDITGGAESKEELMQRLRNHLQTLETAANQVLEQCSYPCKAAVSLEQESFDTRDYETFSLPAGVYDSLRVTIGSGEGKNWWCVVFPQLCLPAASTEVESVAVGAGFSEGLSKTLTKQPGYEIRFFFLDCLGYLENYFKKG